MHSAITAGDAEYKYKLHRIKLDTDISLEEWSQDHWSSNTLEETAAAVIQTREEAYADYCKHNPYPLSKEKWLRMYQDKLAQDE